MSSLQLNQSLQLLKKPRLSSNTSSKQVIPLSLDNS